MKENKITEYISLLILLVISAVIFFYTFEYYTAIKGDGIWLSYGRDFFHPEHGRYLSTFFYSVLGEKIPYLLNLHPNVAASYFTRPVIFIITTLLFIFVSNSFFIFSKPPQKVLSFNFGNIAFYFTYVMLSPILFINQLPVFDEYLSFFDYVFPLLFYVLFMNISLYCIRKRLIPSGQLYKILLLLTFLTGITNEAINIPVFISFCCFMTVFFLQSGGIPKKEKNRVYFLFFVYLLSFCCYYISPMNDKFFIFNNSYLNYLVEGFPVFISQYFNHFLRKMLPVVLLLLGILILSYYKLRDKYFIGMIFISVFSVFIYYFASFFIGYLWGQIYLFDSYKCIYTCICMFINFTLLSFGCLINECIKVEKVEKTVKIIFCIIILVIFCNNMKFSCPEIIEGFRIKSKNDLVKSYVIDKLASDKIEGDKIIIPAHFKMGKYDFDFENSEYMNIAWLLYLKIMYYPKYNNKTEFLYDDNIEPDYNKFTEKELDNPDFQALVKSGISKNVILKNDGCTSYLRKCKYCEYMPVLL